MNLKQSLQKNISTYYFYSVFSNLLILGPIITIYFFSKGLTFTEIMLLTSISSISVTIFEVPTGAVADKIGRKHSLIIGSLLWGISLLFYIFGNHFYLFALGEILFSLGSTFKSGADVAIIYDTLKSLDREKEFQYIEGRAKSYLLYSQAFGSILASFIYTINRELPMIVSVIFMLIAALIATKIIEPPIENKKGKYGEKYFKQIYDSGVYVLNHSKIKAIILYSVVFYVFFRASFFLYQPYFQAVDIPVKLFGFLFFLFNIVAGITSRFSFKIMKKTKNKTLMLLSSLLIISFIILGFTKVWIGFIAIFLQQMARGLYHPVTRKYLNKNIPSDKRATILSFFSLITNLVGSLCYPLFGLLVEKTDIFSSHLIMAAAMFVLTFLTSIYMNKRIGCPPSDDMLSNGFMIK